MELHAYERGDDMLVVSTHSLDGRVLPRASGVLVLTGRCEVDDGQLSEWVHRGLREEGYCAVVGRDAETIRRCLGEPDAVEPPVEPAKTRIEPIWIA